MFNSAEVTENEKRKKEKKKSVEKVIQGGHPLAVQVRPRFPEPVAFPHTGHISSTVCSGLGDAVNQVEKVYSLSH